MVLHKCLLQSTPTTNLIVRFVSQQENSNWMRKIYSLTQKSLFLLDIQIFNSMNKAKILHLLKCFQSCGYFKLVCWINALFSWKTNGKNVAFIKILFDIHKFNHNCGCLFWLDSLCVYFSFKFFDILFSLKHWTVDAVIQAERRMQLLITYSISVCIEFFCIELLPLVTQQVCLLLHSLTSCLCFT